MAQVLSQHATSRQVLRTNLHHLGTNEVAEANQRVEQMQMGNPQGRHLAFVVWIDRKTTTRPRPQGSLDGLTPTDCWNKITNRTVVAAETNRD